MPKLIVCVKSCFRDRKAGFHDAIRETWGKDLKTLGVEVKFFLGHNGHPVNRHVQATDIATEAPNLQRDETMVDAKDDYNSLPHKTRGIAKWAANRMFDHLFLCDSDTIINPYALVQLPFEIADYAGHFRGGQVELGQTFFYEDHKGQYPECYTWASGGIGYFISKQAATVIADTFPKVWAEDMYVGQCLGPLIRNGSFLGLALGINNVATWHFQKSVKFPEFTPDLLRRAHREGGPVKIYKEARAN